MIGILAPASSQRVFGESASWIGVKMIDENLFVFAAIPLSG